MPAGSLTLCSSQLLIPLFQLRCMPLLLLQQLCLMLLLLCIPCSCMLLLLVFNLLLSICQLLLQPPALLFAVLVQHSQCSGVLCPLLLQLAVHIWWGNLQ
jgi:hypothetical protein